MNRFEVQVLYDTHGADWTAWCIEREELDSGFRPDLWLELMHLIAAPQRQAPWDVELDDAGLHEGLY